jgi:protein-tyrosine phosphatase
LINGYVDIHAHVLPGIDDGPSDLEESLALARAAVAAGTTTIAATPHLRPDFPDVHVHELAERCRAVREALERDGISLELISGAEVSLSWALDASDDELRLASYGQHGSDLLIEAPFGQIVGLDRFLHMLRTKGYRITLAHPERNRYFQSDAAPLRDLVDQGVLVQLNGDSLAGHGGRGARRLARHLLTSGLAHVIASDGHRGSSWRPVTRLAEGAQGVAEVVGSERAQWMAAAVPAAIVRGDELPEPPALNKRPRRRGLLRRL